MRQDDEVEKYLLTDALALSPIMTSHLVEAQVLAQPGETMGVAIRKLLPEGVFFVDRESHNKRDGQNSRLGINIPIVAWSTPFSFYDMRLEVLYTTPFTHIEGVTTKRIDSYSQGLLFILANDFGNASPTR